MSPVTWRPLLKLALAGLALACGGKDASTGPSEPPASSLAFAISDAAHRGTPHFFFLPPLAGQPAPTGVFDATLAPTVEICALRLPACGDIIASFTKERGPGGEVLRVDLERELYQVDWKTRDFALSDDVDYRILVRVGTVELGHFDIDVARGATEFRILHTNDVIPLDQDRTLPIRFRAEDGIPGRLAVAPAEARLEVGDRLQLRASVYDLHDRLLSEEFPLRWTTSDPDLVEVDRSGMLLAKSPGWATATASAGALHAGPVFLTVVEAIHQRLAFVSHRSGEFHIYTANVLGGGLLQLTTEGSNMYPQWSPDGAKLAYVQTATSGPYREEILVMNADGSGKTNLSITIGEVVRDGSPVWSPDGGRIAFSRLFKEPIFQNEIYVMNADGTGKMNLSDDAGESDFWPSWSPDGTRIAFLKDHSPYVVNADGSGPPILLTSAVAAGGGVTNGGLIWSPNGTQIAFTDINDIFVIAPDGSGITNLTNSPEQETRPQWSPDGSKLYFFRSPGPNEIWVMNADGTGQQLVVNTGTYGANTFDLTSNGGRLAYVQAEGGFSSWEVFRIYPNGTGQANLTNASGKDFMPVWRP